jgi:hypothetical protein
MTTKSKKPPQLPRIATKRERKTNYERAPEEIPLNQNLKNLDTKSSNRTNTIEVAPPTRKVQELSEFLLKNYFQEESFTIFIILSIVEDPPT